MRSRWIVAGWIVALALGAAQAGSVGLNAVLYPEGKKITLEFETTDRAPKAKLAGAVTVEKNQASIVIDWSKLEPALLFGGDMNCWLVWAVTPDGYTESLGELPVRENRGGNVSFSTPHKEFAVMVTAEPAIVVSKPSEVVAFVSLPTRDKQAKNRTFSYTAFRTTYTQRDTESIATLKYEDKTPVDLQQARKAIRLMDRLEAEKYAPEPAREARVALGQAEDAYAGRVGKKENVPELSRRTTALMAEAVRVAMKGMEAERAASTEAKREAELAKLMAETEAERAARLEVEASLSEVQRERRALEEDMRRLETDRAKLKQERDELARRLSGALGAVASTAQTGRGLVVSLSGGVLFDTGKSLLKQDAEIALAKLAGILLMIPDTTLAIEGHTDSTGSVETNQKLSLERAASVMGFLESQGVVKGRMTVKGVGPAQPVATNDTEEGRAKNRRVEVVIPQSTS
jgi:outer membrane protein OmpA-like peptidoglycan-associated protein